VTIYQFWVYGLLFVVIVLCLHLLVNHELDGTVGHAPDSRNEPLKKDFEKLCSHGHHYHDYLLSDTLVFSCQSEELRNEWKILNIRLDSYRKGGNQPTLKVNAMLREWSLENFDVTSNYFLKTEVPIPTNSYLAQP